MLQSQIFNRPHKCSKTWPGLYQESHVSQHKLTIPQEPPDLINSGEAPDLPPRPQTNTDARSPPPVSQSPDASVSEQARIIKEYEEQQAALVAKREEEERGRLELQMAQQRAFEDLQRQQAQREQQAAEELQRQQMSLHNNQAAQRVNDLEREILGMRSQFERDQLLLQQYDTVGL